MSKLVNRPRCRDVTSTGEPCRNFAAKDVAMYKPGFAMVYFKWCPNHLRRHGIYTKTRREKAEAGCNPHP